MILTEEIKDYIKRIDPTTTKTYFQWITREYEKGKLSIDDLYSDKFVLNLIFFEEEISTTFKITPYLRDINNISYSEFDRLVNQFRLSNDKLESSPISSSFNAK